MSGTEGIFRADILGFAAQTYGTKEEYLWASVPNYAVLRHPSGKWYGIIMDIPKKRLGMDSDEIIDILVIKCDQVLKAALLETQGFLPAYHMNREHWITVLLDGSAEKDLALHLLDASYRMTDQSSKRKKR